MRLGAKLDHALEQPLYSAAVGILNVTTKLDEGIHFLISCLPGSEELRIFEGCSGARSKLEKLPPCQFAGPLDKESSAATVHPFVQFTPQPKAKREVH